MAGIYRVKKNGNFFSASNEPFNDKRLSWGARGIMGHLLSKPDGWEVRDRYLLNQSPDGKHRLNRYINELKEFGYIRRYRARDKFGKFRWITEVYESPELNPDVTRGAKTDPLPENRSMERSITRKTSDGKTSDGKTSDGKTSDGKTSDGKPGSLVITEGSVNTEVVKTEEVNTDTDTAAAAAVFTKNFFVICKTLEVVSHAMPKPITAIKALALVLVKRGETVASVQHAFATCQQHGKKPAAAFMYWCKTSYLPSTTHYKQGASAKGQNEYDYAARQPQSSDGQEDFAARKKRGEIKTRSF